MSLSAADMVFSGGASKFGASKLGTKFTVFTSDASSV